MHRNVTDFRILILYPATLLNPFVTSNSFFFCVCGVFRVFLVSCHLQIVSALLLHYQFFISFLFLNLISVARTSSIMLNKSGESGHPCLVPDLRGKALSFLPLSVMFVWVFHI